MKKKNGLIICFCLIVSLLVGGIVSGAPAGKVDVCHFSTDTGEYIKINISENAFQAHVEHGDASPNEPVPNLEGWAFDQECTPYEVGIEIAGGILPFAFPCEIPLPEIELSIDSHGCAVNFGDPSSNIGPRVEPGDPNWENMIIIQFDEGNLCESPSSSLPCDINSDGLKDIYWGGSENWLLLSEGAGSASLSALIRGEISVSVEPYTWAAGGSGTMNAILGDVQMFEGTAIPVPIYDLRCFEVSPVYCPDLYNQGNPNPPDQIIQLPYPAPNIYYRVIGWRLFYLSCVSKGVVNQCPMRTFLIEQGLADPRISSIEGYFVPETD